MTDIYPISFERFGNKRWKPHSNFHFAAKDTLCNLVASELPKAVMHMAIAFVADKSDRLNLVGIQGVEAGVNLMITSTGQWQGRYFPDVYKCHPFILANVQGSESEKVLCIDEAAGTVTHADDPDGKPFFAEDGKPDPLLSTVLENLQKYSIHHQVTNSICAKLSELDLVKPWPITLTTDSGKIEIPGFYSIDEAALEKLHADAVNEIFANGALLVAYCQLLSMQNLSQLSGYAVNRSASDSGLKGVLNLDVAAENTALNFDNL